MESRDSAKNILNVFDKVTSKPETFVSTQNDVADNLRDLLKQTYDFTKKGEPNSVKSDTLPELIIQNFDLEQIWQQVELQNDYTLNKSVALVSKLAVAKDKLLFDNEDEQQESSNDENAENKSDHDDEEPDSELKENGVSDDPDDSGVDEIEENIEDNRKVEKKCKPSVVDDEFFKLEEMNNFLVTEEKKLNNKKQTKKESDSESESEESVDMFKGGSEDDDDNDEEDDYDGNDKLKNPRYKDFFGTKTQQRMERERRIQENSDNESDEIDSENDNQGSDEYAEPDENDDEPDDTDKPNLKSSLELRQERLDMRIKELEDVAISEKPWQLKGEITAENRPQNCLLEEVLEFDLTARPAPVITEATTQVLEDVIRQRVKDKAFDDVQRKEKPVETPLEYKKKLMLDQEKSKESLAQIYEKEFIEQREALNQNETEKEEEEPQLHKEIKTMMHSLFTKLDALSNFHFTPKPAAPELKVVSNLPAINMEEVAPVAASDATLLAPEEIKTKTKGDAMGKGERTATDKKRERRKKKQKQREHVNEKKKKENVVNKLRPGLGNKYSKEKAKKMIESVAKERNVDKMDESFGTKHMKSSTAFFAQLQDEVMSSIKNKTKAKKKNKQQLDAKRIKL